MDRLAYFRLFHDITSEDCRLLESKLRTRAFHRQEHLVVPGQVQREAYFVRSGIQMSYFDTDKRSHVIAFTYAPNLCAIPSSFSFQQPSEYYLTCLTESELDYISYTDLQELFDRSQQIERLFRRFAEAVLSGMISRHIELHSLSMEERYKVFCRRSPHLLGLVPHKYLASYLGIDATNFSKLFNRVKF